VDRLLFSKQTFGEAERRVYEISLDGLERVLGTNVIGVVCQDDDGVVSVVPGAGIERGVFEVLAQVDWGRLIRLAEEYAP